MFARCTDAAVTMLLSPTTAAATSAGRAGGPWVACDVYTCV